MLKCINLLDTTQYASVKECIVKSRNFVLSENLSLKKTATVSKRYNNKDFDPSLAVDGDDSTDLLKCSLTASGQQEAWLTVDLGEEKNIAAISFVNGGCKYLRLEIELRFVLIVYEILLTF